MSTRYFLSAFALCLGIAQAQAQFAKPQPETPAKPGPQFRTHHQDNTDLRGGGDGSDECANATILTVGASCTTIAGSAAGATQSQAPILCNNFTSGTALDVWFQFTATASSTTVTATGIGDYDVVMEVFSGACGNLVSLGCADATFPPNGLVETFVAATTAGQTYRVRIYSYTPPANTSTSFTICAFSPGGGGAPANDACAGAVNQNLSVPGSITLSGNNTGATVDAPTNFTLVWHQFTTTACANVDLNYCVAGSVFNNFLVNLAVNCPDFITGVLTGTVSPDNCTLSFVNLPAGTYYVPVLVDATVTPVGAYTVNVTSTPCAGGNPPANDDCANATQIGVNATCVATAGTTQDATQSLAPAACSGFTASAANDVWYVFTATAASTTVQVTGAGDATTGMDPVLEVFSGTCAAPVSLGCIDATVRGGTETLTVATTPGATYRYRVYYWPYPTAQTVFGFTTCVISAAPAYCTAGADGTGLGLEERIVNVTMSNINNSSPDAAPVAPAYSDFTNVVGNVVVGQSYPIAIDVARNGANTSYDSNQALVWIDFNQDLDFNDAGEQVFVSTIESIDIFTGNITIPPGTPIGTTRMRIRLHDTHDGSLYTNNFNDTPCGLASYGEVEDYTLSITAGGTTPVNDDCTGAVPVALSTPGSILLSGDNTGATIDPPTPFTVVWEAFTISVCSNVVIDYCQAGSEFDAFFINVAVNCPDVLNGILEGPNDDCTVTFANLPAGTYYIPVRVETDGTTPQGPYTIQVSAQPCAVNPYCDAGADGTGLGLEERIINVTFSDINNSSPDAAPVAPAYSDFTNVVGSVVAGQDYPIAIDVARNGANTSYDSNQALVWIDFNQDQDFFDAGEQVFVSTIESIDVFAGMVSIPANALIGTTRMRIRLHDTHDGSLYTNNFNDTPCGLASYGEVEDYTIDVIGVITATPALDAGAFAVFPNPNDGDMTISYTGATGKAIVELVDATGRIAHSEQIAAVDGSAIALNLAGRLAQGAYTLRISAADGAVMQQRVVVR